VSAAITNFGDEATDAPFVVRVVGRDVDGADVILEETTVVSVLGPSETLTMTILSSLHDAARHGDNELRCDVDASEAIVESDETNNTSSFEIRALGLPDLSWFAVSVGNPFTSSTRVAGTLNNTGPVIATSVDWLVSAGSCDGNPVGGTTAGLGPDVGTLRAGGGVDVSKDSWERFEMLRLGTNCEIRVIAMLEETDADVSYNTHLVVRDVVDD